MKYYRAHVALLGALLTVVALLTLGGCAALPIPFQPTNAQQENSNYAEGAWLVLDAIDTAQTMHLHGGPNPDHLITCNHETDPIAAALYGGRYPSAKRVLLTNLALATVHTMVTSWLDDKVAEHMTDGEGGPWYVGRIAWHTVSLAYSAASVYNNVQHKCAL